MEAPQASAGPVTLLLSMTVVHPALPWSLLRLGVEEYQPRLRISPHQISRIIRGIWQTE